jgi:hypothetical protein
LQKSYANVIPCHFEAKNVVAKRLRELFTRGKNKAVDKLALGMLDELYPAFAIFRNDLSPLLDKLNLTLVA